MSTSITLSQDEISILEQLENGPRSTSGNTNTKLLLKLQSYSFIKGTPTRGNIDVILWQLEEKGQLFLSQLKSKESF